MELLESQKKIFHSQIDQLQDVVVTQCKLTGVNPLAQEMVGDGTIVLMCFGNRKFVFLCLSNGSFGLVVIWALLRRLSHFGFWCKIL